MAETLRKYALCSLDDVKAELNIDPDDPQITRTDDTIIRKINKVSRVIIRESQREFVTVAANPQTRIFDMRSVDVELRRIIVGDLRSFTALRIKDDAGVLLETPTDLTLLPRDAPQNEAPYHTIRFGPTVLNVFTPSTVEIDGTWGWVDMPVNPPAAGIPEDIRNVAISAAAMEFARDVEKFSATFNLDTNRVERPSKLPRALQEVVDDYRLYRVA